MKPATTRHLKRLPLYGAAAALVGASAYQNFEFAIGISTALACAMIASDLLKGPALSAMLEAVKSRDWTRAAIAAPLVVIFALASAAAAISYQAQTRGDAVGERQAVIDKVAALKKQIADAEALRDAQDALADAEAGKTKTKCKTRCLAAMDKAAGAREVIARAQTALAALKPPIEADAGSAALARLMGTDETTARTIMAWIAVALVEVGSLLAFPLALTFGAAKAPTPVPTQERVNGPFTAQQAERDVLYELARGNLPTTLEWAARWNRSTGWVSEAITDMERRGVIKRTQVGRRKLLEVQ